MNSLKSIVVVLLVFSLILTSISQIEGATEAHVNFYIRPDGNVEPYTSQINRTGNIYTFTSNINGTIIFERDNIVIDGAGYTLSAKKEVYNGYGVELDYRHGVTIKNLVVKDTYRGIDLTYADDNTIIGNTIINSEKAIYFWWAWRNNVAGNTIMQAAYAFEFYQSPNYWSQENVVTGNTVLNSSIGLSLMESNNTFSENIINSSNIGVTISGHQNLFRNNTINCPRICFQDSGLDNNIDTSNLVNGKPIIYWMGHRDKTVPSNAGYVVLSKCENIKVKNLQISDLTLFLTTNSLIEGNVFSAGDFGINLRESSNNMITGNLIQNNNNGIQLTNCHDNEIFNNKISANLGTGISLTGSHYNTIQQNIVANNCWKNGDGGIKLVHSSNNVIAKIM